MRPSAALWMPRSPLISSADSGVEAVLQPVDTAQLERPARLKVPRPEKMLSGDPLCHVRLEATCQPPTKPLSSPSDCNHRLPLPKGSSAMAALLMTCV